MGRQGGMTLGRQKRNDIQPTNWYDIGPTSEAKCCSPTLGWRHGTTQRPDTEDKADAEEQQGCKKQGQTKPTFAFYPKLPEPLGNAQCQKWASVWPRVTEGGTDGKPGFRRQENWESYFEAGKMAIELPFQQVRYMEKNSQAKIKKIEQCKVYVMIHQRN